MAEEPRPDWRTLPAGRELDCEVAKVMGWTGIKINRGSIAQGIEPGCVLAGYIPHYSIAPNAAALVLTWIRELVRGRDKWNEMWHALIAWAPMFDNVPAWFFCDADWPLTLCRVAIALSEQLGEERQ